jgi:hypothetical protein
MARFCLIFSGIVLVAVLVFSSPHVSAQMYCSQPDPPSCHRYLMQSSQSWEFDDCRMRIIRFQAELRELFDCHERARIRQEQIRRQLSSELEEAVRRFNDCARDRFC